MTACTLCAQDTPAYRLHILAGDWYCPGCYDLAAAEYDTPEAQARRDAEEADYEAAWPRALALLESLGCTEDQVADEYAWSALCNDAQALLAKGWPETCIPELVALYTRGDMTGLPDGIAARYILAPASQVPRGQLDLFATTRPKVSPRKDFSVRWTGPCGPLRPRLTQMSAACGDGGFRPEIPARQKTAPVGSAGMHALPPA